MRVGLVEIRRIRILAINDVRDAVRRQSVLEALGGLLRFLREEES